MGIVNIVAKFLVQPQNDFIVITNGEVKIFGADDATTALLQTEFEELIPFSPSASSSSSKNASTTALSTVYGTDKIELNEAFGKITSYLNFLAEQEFTVVSAFKDELCAAPSGNSQYKIYIWTMQKLSYEIYEGSLGTCGPLPLLSWTVYINGLRSRYRAAMQKFYPELKESFGSSLSYSQNANATLPATMAFLTNYLNWLDGEGFKVVGSSMDSSTYHGGVTKTQIYTLQMQDLSVP